MDRGGADPFAELKRASEEYKVYDSHYERIGRVDDLIVGEGDRVAYIGVKMGFFGTNSTLIPVEIVRVNDRRRLIEVFEPAETIRHAPHFGSSEELSPELENHVRTYFGLEGLRPSPEHEPRGPYPPIPATGDRSISEEPVDVAPDERAASQDSPVPAPESAPQEERPVERQPEHAEEQEPISERLSDKPGSFWERLTTGGGVTVHRLRR